MCLETSWKAPEWYQVPSVLKERRRGGLCFHGYNSACQVVTAASNTGTCWLRHDPNMAHIVFHEMYECLCVCVRVCKEIKNSRIKRIINHKEYTVLATKMVLKDGSCCRAAMFIPSQAFTKLLWKMCQCCFSSGNAFTKASRWNQPWTILMRQPILKLQRRELCP